MRQIKLVAPGPEDRRARLYEAYASTHAGRKDRGVEAAVFRQEILPRLPGGDRATCSVVDIGCGQGSVVQQLIRHGYTSARGVDISAEQVALAHANGVDRVECGDYRELLKREAGRLHVVIATDFIEHFTKDEVMSIFDNVRAGLRPGGVLIVRSPNAMSPFFGNYQYSDFTHETVFTPRSFAQVAAIAGFSRSEAFSAGPVRHDVKSALRQIVWAFTSVALRVALAAETGGHDHIVTQNFIGVAKT